MKSECVIPCDIICPPSSRVSPVCHSAKPFGQGHTHRAHINRRRLIMPLVALVQKNHSAPATSYQFWCLGFASSSPLLLAFRLRRSECCISTPPINHTLSKNALFGCITRKKHRGQTAVYLSYIRVALGVSDEVRRQIARFYFIMALSQFSLGSSPISFATVAATFERPNSPSAISASAP